LILKDSNRKHHRN